MRSPGDRIFSFNHQIWNKTHRWEIGFLPDENSQTENDTNFVVILVGEKQAESISNQIKSFAFTQPKLIGDLRGTNFQQANLQQADLTGADLSAPTFLEEADLRQAILVDSDLRGANFRQANLRQADLTGADLTKRGIKLKNIPNNYNFGKQLADAFIGLPIFALTNSKIDFFTSFIDANLQGANLSFANIDRVDFENANLTNINFTESSIDPEDLEDLELCGVTLADGTKSDRDCS